MMDNGLSYIHQQRVKMFGEEKAHSMRLVSNAVLSILPFLDGLKDEEVIEVFKALWIDRKMGENNPNKDSGPFGRNE